MMRTQSGVKGAGGEAYESNTVAAINTVVPVVAFIGAGTIAIDAHGVLFWTTLVFMVLFGLTIFARAFPTKDDGE